MAKKSEQQLPAPTVYLNPLTDFGFKKVFGDKELMIDLLNETLPEAHITDVKYQPTEHLGDWGTERKAVYVVSLLNFNLDDTEDSEVIERVSLMNERTKKKFSTKLNFTYIQLPKFTKKIEELETNMDYWLFLLKNLDNFQSRPPEVQGRIFERLFHIARYDKLKPEEMKSYNKSILEYSDIAEAIEYAGERAEKRKSIQFAKKCLQKGMNVVEIADLTDLPIETVKDIIKGIQG
ncbi:hypothetical protein FACS189430_11720 [Bacteroidia bacterium]|nr:hypothetical protein FACS189430_11720 [Bacteroidia bacterium]